MYIDVAPIEILNDDFWLVVGAEVKSSGCPFRRWIESGGDAGKAVRMADDQDLPTDCPVSSSFWMGRTSLTAERCT